MKNLEYELLHLPLPNAVFFGLVETTAQLVGVSEQYWQSRGINGARIRVLVEIMKHGGEMLPSALAEQIGVTKANISLLLGPLEQEKLISRKPHPQDGRKTVIQISASGKNLLQEQLPGNRETVARAMSKLNEDELQQLRHLLAKLRR